MGIKHSTVMVSGQTGLHTDWNAEHVVDDDSKPKNNTTLIVAASNSLDTSRADYVCDGINDEAQINAAVAALPAPGGRISLLEGQFEIEAPILIDKSNVSIIGVGAATVLHAAAVFANGVIHTDGSVAEIFGITIADLTVNCDGNAKGIFLEDGGFAANGVTKSTVRDCWVHNGSDYGIHESFQASTHYNTYINNHCYDCGVHGMMVVSGAAQIINNVCHGNGADGISVQFADNVVLIGNRCYDNDNWGIRLRGGDSATVQGNQLKNNSQGGNNTFDELIVEQAGDDNVIVGNHIECTAGIKARYGIYIDAAACTNNIVVANRVTGAVTGNIQDNGVGTTVASNNTA